MSDDTEVAAEQQDHIKHQKALLADMVRKFDEHRAEMDEWVRTPLPPYIHSCQRHIRRQAGSMDSPFGMMTKCACGGFVFGDGVVLEKNSSRKFHRRERRERGYPRRGQVAE